MTMPPRTATIRPTIVARVRPSFSKKGESNATHRGPVDTNTTELATDVYSSEEIHVAKCTARKTPAMPPRIISFCVRPRSSSRWCPRARGASNRAAHVSRSAAITREGASACAKRTRTEEVETASTAVRRANGTTIRTRGWSICPFYCLTYEDAKPEKTKCRIGPLSWPILHFSILPFTSAFSTLRRGRRVELHPWSAAIRRWIRGECFAQPVRQFIECEGFLIIKHCL